MRGGPLLLASVALDVALGDPPTAIHPVGWIGTLIERLAGAPTGRRRRDLARGSVAVAVPAAVAWLVGRAVERRANTRLGALLSMWLLSSSFALRTLRGAGLRVARALEIDDLEAARSQLPWLVSRPNAGLDRAHVASATIESLAENLADSYVAPLCAYAVGGLPAALAYRAVNTADAMLGYRDEREHLGKAAARLDDLVNLVPARLSAALLVVAAGATLGSGRRAARVARRDASRTASPNAGWPMATAAGALGVWLEKPGAYRLGDGRSPDTAEVRAAVNLVTVAAAIATATLLAWEIAR